MAKRIIFYRIVVDIFDEMFIVYSSDPEDLRRSVENVMNESMNLCQDIIDRGEFDLGDSPGNVQ